MTLKLELEKTEYLNERCEKGEGLNDVTRHKAAEPASCNALVPQCPSALVTSKAAAFTLAEGRLAWQTKSAFTHRETAKEVRSTIIYNVPRHKATDPKTCNHSITQSLNHLVTSKKAAFTLAEVLITLAIIGVVAVLTIPGLIKNHNEKAWSTAQSVFEKRLEVAVKQLNTEEKLAGYDSTMDFVNELKKYIKITRVCDNSEITKCFDKEVIWNEGEEPIDMSAIKNAQSFGLDWDSDTVAVQFANGVNAVIAYNPNATQDPFNNQFSATSNSMAILYDVSGNKNPNTNGKDIAHINITELAGTAGCMIPELADTMCITQILGPQNGGYGPMTYAECNAQKDELGIRICYSEPDYWAGAVKACGGTSNMPTMEQLGQLATYLYNYPSTIGALQNINSGVSLDTEKASQFLSTSPYSDYFHVWSRLGPSSVDLVFNRKFFPTYTNSTNGLLRNFSGALAVCVGKQ